MDRRSIRVAEWWRGSAVRRGRLLMGWSVGLLLVSLFGMLWAIIPKLSLAWTLFVLVPGASWIWFWKQYYWLRILEGSGKGSITLVDLEIIQEVDGLSVTTGKDFGILRVEGSSLAFRGETSEFRLHRGHVEPRRPDWEEGEAKMVLKGTPTQVTVRFRSPSDRVYFDTHVLEWLKEEPVGSPVSVYPPLLPQVSSRKETKMRVGIGVVGSVLLTAACASMGSALLAILLVPGLWALLIVDDTPRRYGLVEKALLPDLDSAVLAGSDEAAKAML